MTSLVDRYVHTALRRVPEQQRADKLADGYAGRPGYLIGPELFAPWRRLTTTLLTVVLPIVVVVLVVLDVVDGNSIGGVIGTAVSGTLTVGVQMVFWTTLVFAIVERTGTARDRLKVSWSLDDLPEYEPDRVPIARLAAGLVWPALLIAALIWQQVGIASEPVLDPANWSFWWPYFIVVLALRGACQVWVWRRGTGNRTVAVVTVVLELAFAIPLIWLLNSDRFFNPAFHTFAKAGAESDVKHWLTVLITVLVLVGTAKDIYQAVRRRG